MAIVKTYGTLSYEPAIGGGRGTWAIDCAPHVAIKIKRTFARATQARTATIRLSDTSEVARDLEWFLDRWPLEIAPDVQARLTARADEHRAQEEATEQILAGTLLTEPGEWLTPARPHRDYQQKAVDLATVAPGLLLADDVGLGKTQSTLGILRDPAALPALVVTLTHLPRQWEEEVNEIFPTLTTHIATKQTPYPVTADVLIMNYAKMAGWRNHLAGAVQSVIFDEVHELRRNGTQRHDSAVQISRAARWRVGASATPVMNYGGEIHNIYDVLAPDVLGDHAEFLREWGGRQWNNNTMVADPDALGQYLRDQGVLLRRTRRDVHLEMPDPIPIFETVPSDPRVLDSVAGDVAAMAALILDENADHRLKWQARGDLDWRLRHATGIAKAPFVAEFVRLLLESEEKVALFGWHHDVYAIWADRLAEFNPVQFTGRESVGQKHAAIDRFTDGDSRVLMMSLRAGAGLDGLQKVCSAVVFGELDWTPDVHTQAIGRFHRDGQDSTVVAYYLVSEDGSDPVIADVHEVKRQQSKPMLDPQADLFTTVPTTEDRVRRLAQQVVAAGRTNRVA